MARKNRGKNYGAPYHVQMREAERRLLLGALTYAEGDLPAAATMLGIERAYFKARAIFLGGVLPGQGKNEPPTNESILEAWSASGAHGTVKPKPRRSTTTTVTTDDGATVVARDRTPLVQEKDGDA